MLRPYTRKIKRYHHWCSTRSLLIILLFSLKTAAQEVVYSVNNGPFVHYKGDSIVVQHIKSHQGKERVTTQAYHLNEKRSINIPVNFSNKRRWNFEVQLQSSLLVQKAVWPQPAKLLALSDIEGQFGGLRELLLANKVIDKKYNWIFGDGHLVICGDLFDRGSYVMETLWLLYKLEQSAVEKGGYVHVILGNHDIMNLSGDYRYVEPRYINHAKLLGTEYDELFTTNTELGRWLRSKNIVEKIGENLCTHGGISQAINDLQLSLEEMNSRSRPYYDQAEKEEVYSIPLVKVIFADSTSPFWYRGYFTRPRATLAQVDQTLKLYDCKKIIVGHTILAANVASYYQGKLIAVDVNHHEGKHEGALFQNNQWYTINTSGRKKPLPQVE